MLEFNLGVTPGREYDLQARRKGTDEDWRKIQVRVAYYNYVGQSRLPGIKLSMSRSHDPAGGNARHFQFCEDDNHLYAFCFMDAGRPGLDADYMPGLTTAAVRPLVMALRPDDMPVGFLAPAGLLAPVDGPGGRARPCRVCEPPLRRRTH